MLLYDLVYVVDDDDDDDGHSQRVSCESIWRVSE